MEVDLSFNKLHYFRNYKFQTLMYLLNHVSAEKELTMEQIIHWDSKMIKLTFYIDSIVVQNGIYFISFYYSTTAMYCN
jgi:hypothetical protein